MESLSGGKCFTIVSNTPGNCFNSNYRVRCRMQQSTHSVLDHDSCLCCIRRLWCPEVHCEVRGQICLSMCPVVVPNLLVYHSKAMPQLTQLVAGLSLQRPGFKPVSKSYGISCEQSDIEADFLRVLRFPLPIVPPTALYSSSSEAITVGQIVTYIPRGLCLKAPQRKKQNFKAYAWNFSKIP
jgi:hypothetical protein